MFLFSITSLFISSLLHITRLLFPPLVPSLLESQPSPLTWLRGLEGGQRKVEDKDDGEGGWTSGATLSRALPEGDSFPAQKRLHSSFDTCQGSTLGEERLIGEMDSIPKLK